MINNPIKSCPECGGKRVIATLQTDTAGGPRFMKYPANKLWNNPTSDILTLVCINCGYASLYAKNPERLVDSQNKTEP
jgi:hypothetical protein